MARSVDISLLNQNLKVKTNSDEKVVSSVVSYVRERLGQIQEKAKGSAPLSIALLTCLNIALEFHTYKEAKEARSATAGRKIVELLAMIDGQRKEATHEPLCQEVG